MYEEQLYALICENMIERDLSDKAQLACFTTSHMAGQLGLARNLVSASLNRLYGTGALVKVKTRPVYYFDRTQLELHYGVGVPSTLFYSLEQLFALLQKRDESDDVFSAIIGHDKSLREPISQCKAAAFYPGTGLPMLISGPSGSGKSLLAKLIHAFCIDKGVIEPEAPFVTFNCSDYADNPELLTGILFGYIKGAFTGADRDREGLLQQADGGVLFLDEAHRLSPNGQEKLFLFMDQGVFSRLGDAKPVRRSTVRLVFATTEQPQVTFLVTFLRRIPVFIRMPALEEKGTDELMQLICHILARQSTVLGKEFLVDQHFFQFLLGCKLPGNIGELSNVIQYACAAAYQQYGETEEGGDIRLEAHHLPEYVIRQRREMDWEGIEWNAFPERVRITPDFRFESIRRLLQKPMTSLDIRAAFYNIFNAYQGAAQKQQSDGQVISAMLGALCLYMDMLSEDQEATGKSVQYDMYHAAVIALLEGFYEEHAVGMRGKIGMLFSMHLFRRANYLNLDAAVPLRPAEEVVQFFGRTDPQICVLARELKERFENGLGLNLRVYDTAILCLGLYWNLYQEQLPARGMIMAAGKAVASSMAAAINTLLKTKVFEAANLDPSQGSAQAQALLLKFVLRRKEDPAGSVILVDNAAMAQLLDGMLRCECDANYLLICEVGTELARQVGEALKADAGLEEIEALAGTLRPAGVLLRRSALQKKPIAIVTTCITGMGTAEKLAALLRESISPWLPEMVFLPRNYKNLRINGVSDDAFRDHQVIAIFGTADPKVEGIPFIDLGQAMIAEEAEPLSRVLSAFLDEDKLCAINARLVINFSLQRVLGYLTILNPERVMESVREFIERLEHQIRRQLGNPVKLLLYVHISCMIERLIKKSASPYYENLADFQKKQKKFIKAARASISVIEETYSVRIPDEEIGCLYDIVSLKQNSSVFSREI